MKNDSEWISIEDYRSLQYDEDLKMKRLPLFYWTALFDAYLKIYETLY